MLRLNLGNYGYSPPPLVLSLLTTLNRLHLTYSTQWRANIVYRPIHFLYHNSFRYKCSVFFHLYFDEALSPLRWTYELRYHE